MVPCLGDLKSHLCLLAQSLAACNFIYREPTGGRDPQHLGVQIPAPVIWEAELTQIALEPIHNTQPPFFFCFHFVCAHVCLYMCVYTHILCSCATVGMCRSGHAVHLCVSAKPLFNLSFAFIYLCTEIHPIFSSEENVYLFT